MSKADYLEAEILALLFNADPIPNIADNASTAPLTQLYVSLHTADPGEAGNQQTNEVTTGAYDTYTRIGVARTAGGWTLTASSISPVANITFPTATGGTGATITHVGIGTDAAGVGNLLYYGALTPNIAVSNGTTPEVTSASTITED